MKIRKLIFIILLLKIYSCNHEENSGIVIMECNEPTINRKADKTVIYFLSGFNNDTVQLKTNCNSIQKGIFTTDKSLMFASAYTLKKCDHDVIHLNINQKVYSIPVRDGYIAIDIKKLRDTLSICYHNAYPKILE